MQNLPLKFKSFYPDNLSGANVTQSYWFEPVNKAELKQKGGAGLFVSITGPDEFNGERAAKFMWDVYREKYFELVGSINDSLKISVRAAQDRLRQLIKNQSGISDIGVDLHLCAVVIHDESIHFSIIGEPEVILIRGGRLVNVSDMVPGYDGVGYKTEIPVGSFRLERNDVLIISTPELVSSFLAVFDKLDIPDRLGGWKPVLSELEGFSENMAGNQYFWCLGYNVKETKAEKFTKKEGIDESDTVREDASDEPKISESDESSARPETSRKVSGRGVLYTLGGIWSRVEGGFKKTRQGIKEKVVDEKTGKFSFSSIVESFKGVNFKDKLVKIKRKFLAKVTSMKVDPGKKRKLYVEKIKDVAKPGNPKRFVIIGVFVIIAIIVGVFVSIRYRRNVVSKGIDEDLNSMEEQIDKASNFWKVDNDKMSAVDKLEGVKSGLEDLDTKKFSEDQLSKLSNIENSVTDLEDDIYRIVAFSEEEGNFEILMELYLTLGESVEATDIDIKDGELYVVDYATHKVYAIDPESSDVEQIGKEDELKEPKYIGLADKTMFIYDEKLGIVSLDMEQDRGDWSFEERAELSKRTVGDVKEIGTFGDNVYYLRPDTNRVYKSIPAGAGYSYPEFYIDQTELKNAVDILIDGNIYIIGGWDSKIMKFRAGEKDAFEITQLDKPLGEVECGYTNLYDDVPLYIYDKENQRFVVIEKGKQGRHPGVGVMKYQYVYRGERDDVLKNVADFVVDEDENNMYVLDGTRILKVSLSDG